MGLTTKPIHVYRGEVIESTHDIHVAVVAPGGELIGHYGDVHRLTFARSSMKPFQAVPIIEAGAMETYGLTEKELALFCASHSGEPFHRKGVAEVLHKLDLQESHLQCGTHVPRDMDSYRKLIKEGGKLTPFYSNCSGKHAGMLAGCIQQQLNINTYRDKNHPYQQQIIDIIADMSSFPQENIITSVDGCGVPVHRLPLYHLALAFSRLASPEHWDGGDERRKSALRRINQAMTDFPEMVAGTDQFDTDIMTVFEGRLVAKGGAEGVHCFGDRKTGIGVAIKAEDGHARAATVAAMNVLKQLDIGHEDIYEQLHNYIEVPVLNARQEKVGAVQAAFDVTMSRHSHQLSDVQ